VSFSTDINRYNIDTTDNINQTVFMSINLLGDSMNYEQLQGTTAKKS